jgi:hypothetical protein
MRLTCFFACLIVSIESVARATGLEKQSIFSDSTIFLWWGFAAFWLYCGFEVLFRGTER